MADKGTAASDAVNELDDDELETQVDETHSGEEKYRIGDLSEEFGVTPRALRFYEGKGLIAPGRRGNTRIYKQRDKARLRLILLGRKVGMPLRDIKTILDLYEPGGTNVRQLRVALDKSERQLVRLDEQRASIDEAIATLRDVIKVMRNALAGVSDGNTPPAQTSDR